MARPRTLTENRIGSAVFGKAQDYSVVEDSSVRVHVRQLRLKLHEYFDGEGREEGCVVEIQGAYTTLFALSGSAPPRSRSGRRTQDMDSLATLGTRGSVSGHHRHGLVLPSCCDHATPAPVAAGCPLHSPDRPVQVVVADVNYRMTRLVDEQPVTLERYLSPSYRSGADLTNAHPTKRETRMMRYLSGSLLPTSSSSARSCA